MQRFGFTDEEVTMTEHLSHQDADLGDSIVLRISQKVFEPLKVHLSQDPHTEQFAFLLCSKDDTPDGSVFLGHSLILPEAGDLREQSCVGIAPSDAFQGTTYYIAQQREMSIFDIHTHTHSGQPFFSGIDHSVAEKNAAYICKMFPAPVTHGMVVYGNDVLCCEAVAYDRKKHCYCPIERIEVLGRGSDITYPGGERRAHIADSREEQYARQRLISGWNQESLGEQRILVVGMGGNGAAMLAALLAIGAGAGPRGWIAIADPEKIEPSNLSRIPYAFPSEHIGMKKVEAGRQYAEQRCPEANLYSYASSVNESDVLERAKAATILIGAGDNDGVRRILNELSVRYLIPYVDLGCDVENTGDGIVAGGQVHVVLPGENACLVCCRGYDPAQAAMDLATPEQTEFLQRHGYGLDTGEAAPSIINLNTVTAQLGVTAVLALVHGSRFGSWDYAHYDQTACKLTTAKTERSPACPLCGDAGVLGEACIDETLEAKRVARGERKVLQLECGKWSEETTNRKETDEAVQEG